jgi:hypothetical protein
VLIVLKQLLLAEYQIEVGGLSRTLIGALVVAKVVLVMEHVPLGQWVRTHASVFDVTSMSGRRPAAGPPSPLGLRLVQEELYLSEQL